MRRSSTGGPRLWPAPLLGALVLISGCADPSTGAISSETLGAAATASPAGPVGPVVGEAVLDRVAALQAAVDGWRRADTIEQAHAFAARARVLVVGGSLDAGTVALTSIAPEGLSASTPAAPTPALSIPPSAAGSAAPTQSSAVTTPAPVPPSAAGSATGGEPGQDPRGLLPGLTGQPGLGLPASSCVEQDVLGGSFLDASGRWDTLRAAIGEWSPGNNTFPSLPSHPQRVVGWASLTLATEDLDLAHEYSGHAGLHVDITRDALDGC